MNIFIPALYPCAPSTFLHTMLDIKHEAETLFLYQPNKNETHTEKRVVFEKVSSLKGGAVFP